MMEAVHGSYLRNWPSIHQQGLSCMNRTHIHLSTGLPGEDGIISGMRKNCDLAVFIDVSRALAGDAEGKLLPKYFTRALKLNLRSTASCCCSAKSSPRHPLPGRYGSGGSGRCPAPRPFCYP
uniref:tRNA phosphotransferase 1 n=1 Tax=Poecilia latipinna TaxID=48699 RepID=A0A3B3V1L9_9TELE